MVHGTLPLFSRPVYRHSVRAVRLLLARSPRFVSLLRSRPLSRISFSVPLAVVPPHTLIRSRSRSFTRSVTVTPCHSYDCCFSLARTLLREYCVLTEIAEVYPSSSLIYHPPPGTITEFSRSVYRRCCPPLPPPMFPPTIALSPSGSVSLHLSMIFVLSLPLDLSSASFSWYDSSAPPIERSSNSTTCRQIKFVLVRRARHIQGA